MEIENRELNIDGKKINYLIVPYHRDGTPKKSQWTISKKEEIDCFTQSVSEGWTDGSSNYGINFDSEKNITYLGENQFNENLLVAKFVTNTNDWHGYPSDYVRNTRDIPNFETLKEWRDQEIITKSQMLKIKRGQPCNL